MSIVKLPNEVELGRYRLTARLGHGGMAELFLGRLVGVAGFEKLVAIKRMLPNLSSDPSFVKMFENEGRIAAQLSHPNVCQVYELGESDGQLFLAMEFLRGLPLSDIIPSIPDRPLATQLRFVAGVIVQACEGLHYAHTSVDVDGKPRPIVHRDVSPTNLFVTTEGTVKLLDFGVSKVITDATSTRAGVLKGKPSYMSPEQIRGEPLDARCDIFAIAVVTWEAIAGRVLFPREAVQDLWRTAQEQVPRLPGDGPVIALVDQTVRRALDPDRERRPSSARAFAIDLRRAIEACGDPMSPSEIQSHVEVWLESNLARRSRDLAGVVGRAREQAPTNNDDEPETVPLEPQPTLGARLRDASVVVRDAHDPSTEELDVAPTLEHIDAATATQIDVQAHPIATQTDVQAHPQTVPLPTAALRPPAPAPQALRPPAPAPQASLPSLLPSGTVTQQLTTVAPAPVAPPRPVWFWPVVLGVAAIVVGVIAALSLS
ncbi:MAG TPA: serine/threonine-protein kinase [Kofleriaceae bacterium]